jgi:acyl-CoA dehydrogenase
MGAATRPSTASSRVVTEAARRFHHVRGDRGIADVHVVVATVDPEAGHRGQGVFIVPKGTPGLTMLRKLDKLDCRASHTGEIVFEDCRVPADQLLGGEERLAERIAKGREAEHGSPPPASTAEEGGPEAAVQRRSSAALSAFERTRPMVAAQAIGIARAALEFARDYATEREAFGQAIIENQGISFRWPTWPPTSTPPAC